jgi:hypothetical protein
VRREAQILGDPRSRGYGRRGNLDISRSARDQQPPKLRSRSWRQRLVQEQPTSLPVRSDHHRRGGGQRRQAAEIALYEQPADALRECYAGDQRGAQKRTVIAPDVEPEQHARTADADAAAFRRAMAERA